MSNLGPLISCVMVFEGILSTDLVACVVDAYTAAGRSPADIEKARGRIQRLIGSLTAEHDMIETMLQKLENE